MILHELQRYYERSQGTQPPLGFKTERIKFVIEIKPMGEFSSLSDLRDDRSRGTECMVPADPLAMKRTSATPSADTAYSLWDNTGYVCGRPKDDTPRAVEAAESKRTAFVEKVERVAQALPNCLAVQAVRLFYERNQLEALRRDPLWEECARIDGANITFRIAGQAEPVLADPQFMEYVRKQTEESYLDESGLVARCLITGSTAPIARLHDATPISGSKSTAGLVSMQVSAGYDSYGLTKAYNAPVSVKSMKEYTTALKGLLGSRDHTLRLGDLTTVVWASQVSAGEEIDFESHFVSLLEPQRDDPAEGVAIRVQSLRQAVFSGSGIARSTGRFCVLGLLPNAGRISVALWEECEIGALAQRITQHHSDLEVVRPAWGKPILGLYDIAGTVSRDGDISRVPRNLLPRVLESAVRGTPYPMHLYQGALIRVRTERNPQSSKHIAVMKACLNRWARHGMFQAKEVGVALDPAFDNAGYQLGRAFAVLQKIQEDAAGGRKINATIVDRYYGSASTSPATVFPQLLRLKIHHLAKLPDGSKVFYERLLGEIMSSLSKFPAHLTLQQQGYFAIGYYHQRQDLFTRRDDSLTVSSSTLMNHEEE